MEAIISPQATTAPALDHLTLQATTTREEISVKRTLETATETVTTMAEPEMTQDLPSIVSRDREAVQEDTTTAIDATEGTRLLP